MTYDEAFALLPEEDRQSQRPGLMMASIYRELLLQIKKKDFPVKVCNARRRKREREERKESFSAY